ncbi:MAG: bifunctional oligoribonuclease/PAP phosphatase NrnA, partial [Haloplanus sp.]
MSVAAEEFVQRAVTFAQSHPELLAALLVSLVVLIGGGYVLHQFTRPSGVRFTSMLADQDQVSILTHPNPDPDAMAA